eukprot:TRINITY_DN3661_c0_g1_i2.p1 TRINITY_DN3661_c0_g1~~TRINITY_DN3661_c0_g1_i2.p1  ORF type:complete len:444 (+),score=89.70 TRINITY_DN3661_c0_g1_i2:131-1462(+)
MFDHLFRAFVRPKDMPTDLSTDCLEEGMARTLKALSLQNDGLENGYCFGRYESVIENINCASPDKIEMPLQQLLAVSYGTLNRTESAYCHVFVYYMLENQLNAFRSVLQTIHQNTFNIESLPLNDWKAALENKVDLYCTHPNPTNNDELGCNCFDGYQIDNGPPKTCQEALIMPCLRGEGTFDECGQCNGDNSTCRGCDGVLFSGKVIDKCGVCGGSSNTCIGCDGVMWSNKTIDQCGLCGGDNACLGCDGMPWSNKTLDACGVCDGDNSTCTGCDGILFSNKTLDQCYVCDGDGQSCLGCDGVPFSEKELDQCHVCGGNGLSCMGCDNVLFSGAQLDACGVCQGDNSTCVGCDGVPNSKTLYNDCGTCADTEEFKRCKQLKAEEHLKKNSEQQHELRDVALRFLGASFGAIGICVAMAMTWRWLKKKRRNGFQRLPTDDTLP